MAVEGRNREREGEEGTWGDMGRQKVGTGRLQRGRDREIGRPRETEKEA